MRNRFSGKHRKGEAKQSKHHPVLQSPGMPSRAREIHEIPLTRRRDSLQRKNEGNQPALIPDPDIQTPRQDLMTCLAQDAGFQPLLTQQHYIKSGQLESNQVTQHDRQQPKEATLIRISSLLPGRTSTLASLHMQFATESYQGATCNWKEWHPPARQITVDRCISSS
jgi:hypothetical protein